MSQRVRRSRTPEGQVSGASGSSGKIFDSPEPRSHQSFTLPAVIGDIACRNKVAIYGNLLRATAETLVTIAADPKHLGARIALTAVLHSWGSALTHHPHVHIAVPGGGISLDGQRWISCRPGFFLPVRVLPGGFHRIRYDGLFANTGRVQHRAIARALLAVPKPMSDTINGASQLIQSALAGSGVCRS
jgi:hypothetical protein